MSKNRDALKGDIDWLRRCDLLPLPKEVIQGWLRAQARMRVDLEESHDCPLEDPLCDGTYCSAKGD